MPIWADVKGNLLKIIHSMVPKGSSTIWRHLEKKQRGDVGGTESESTSKKITFLIPQG